MLFEFDAEQRLWRDTVRDALSKECPPALVRAIADQGADPDPLWRAYAKFGWCELTAQQDAVELGMLVDELGYATDPTPYLATLTQYAPLAPARLRQGRAGAAVWEGVRVEHDTDGTLRLTGTGTHVLDGDRAEEFAVVTEEGIFAVPAEAATTRRLQVFDPLLHIAEVTFDDVAVGGYQRTGADPAHARRLALGALSLTMVGACRRVLDLTLEHIRARKQFGAVIGSFQAVKHKAADMHVAIERASALGYFALLTHAEGDPRGELAASMAKAAAGECQDLVFRHGVQLHGAMGTTWENDLQFALKRAKAGELLLGGQAEHRAIVARETVKAQQAQQAQQAQEERRATGIR